MTIDLETLLARRREAQHHHYDETKVQLYALGVGLGMDPLDEHQLDFVLEDRLKVLPSFATVAVWDIGFKLDLGIDWSKLIHASQRMRMYGTLPPSGEVIADTRFKAAFDKPARNATLLVDETAISDSATGELIAEIEHVSLARDFRVQGAPEGSPERLAAPPARNPDKIVSVTTSPQVTLIYRLLGGRSRIHSHPQEARSQGFNGPIMHGLSTWGHICHLVIKEACGYDPERLESFATDFKAPVYPGETLETRLWFESKAIFFETLAAERNILVLANGNATVREAA